MATATSVAGAIRTPVRLQNSSALLKAVTPNDLREVVSALLSQAKAGDVPAAKELLQRLLGPPVELDLLERMAAMEQRLVELQDRGWR